VACPSQLSTWIELATTGLVLGALYAMIALGYTMVYGVLQLLNFAHSEVFMVGSFGGVYALLWVGVHGPRSGISLVLTLLFAFLVAMAFGGATAILLERIAYRPLRRRGASRLTYLIAAIGASLFLSNLFLLLDGERHLGLPFDWPAIAGRAPVSMPEVLQRHEVFTFLGVSITNIQILIVVVALVMMFVLDRFVGKTKLGMGVRAVAEDQETASMMGVSINSIIVLTFLLGGLMAGAAGLLYGLNFGVTQFNLGFIPGIKAFTAAVLGGIGNIRGAVLGGILLGLIENLGIACVSAQWKDVIAFAVLILVLMFRPTGILGEQVGG
jgi:branched-chain amino acid transport system permease protein